MNRIRVANPTTVGQIAVANHVPLVRTSHAASVTLADVVYFWAAR